MKKLLLGLVLSCLFPLSVMADDSAGCGVGQMVTNKKSLLATSTQSTTNYFLPPTFSMTSGTSGCAKHSIAKNEEPAAIYAVNNYESLALDMSKGQGEYLAAFARTMGCTDAALPEFQNMSQKNFGAILSESNGSGIDLFKSFRSHVQQNEVLASSCHLS